MYVGEPHRIRKRVYVSNDLPSERSHASTPVSLSHDSVAEQVCNKCPLIIMKYGVVLQMDIRQIPEECSRIIPTQHPVIWKSGGGALCFDPGIVRAIIINRFACSLRLRDEIAMGKFTGD
ncbi:hypothetical protein TNIN_156491 [Trichonephila inaurata madagascariensis]|uniref:Uncharacterized protein n=2 Tax=Trichonephila inaurata madagascariensis TaxID=2747483 RepID=A0A8X7C2E7_9ARAC|nr:hypothetical protein TNIN_156491 [Trichonephila inaurata madagascariensis]